MIEQFLSRQFLIFLATGCLAALANFLSRIILNQFFSFSTSVIIAYIIGMIIAYILFRTIVFDAKKSSLRQSIVYFIAVNAIGILLTYVISMFLYFWLFPLILFKFYPDTIAHLIGISVPAFSSYIGHKYLTFKDKS